MRTLNFIIYTFIFLVFVSCTKELGSDCISGNGNIENRVVNLETITKIDLSMQGSVEISEGPQMITIEAPSDIIDKILSESILGSDKWTIQINECYNGPTIKVKAQLPLVELLEISGSGNIFTSDTLSGTDQLALEINGSGNMNIFTFDANSINLQIKGSGNVSIESKRLDIFSCNIQGSGDVKLNYDSGQTVNLNIEGSGDIEIAGETVEQIINIEGSGDVLNFDLITNICKVESRGQGNCELNVIEELDILIEGSGDVCYRGSPTLTIDVSGSGEIKNCN